MEKELEDERLRERFHAQRVAGQRDSAHGDIRLIASGGNSTVTNGKITVTNGNCTVTNSKTTVTNGNCTVTNSNSTVTTSESDAESRQQEGAQPPKKRQKRSPNDVDEKELEGRMKTESKEEKAIYRVLDCWHKMIKESHMLAPEQTPSYLEAFCPTVQMCFDERALPDLSEPMRAMPVWGTKRFRSAVSQFADDDVRVMTHMLQKSMPQQTKARSKSFLTAEAMRDFPRVSTWVSNALLCSLLGGYETSRVRASFYQRHELFRRFCFEGLDCDTLCNFIHECYCPDVRNA